MHFWCQHSNTQEASLDVQGITTNSCALLLCWILLSYEYTNQEEREVDVSLWCKCNTHFWIHLCLSHMTHSPPEVPQQHDYPSHKACVLMDWHHGRNCHQRKNMIMNWHHAHLRCLARNKRFFKTLELSTKHLTGRIRSHYAASCLHTSPLALPAVTLFLWDLSTNELYFQFFF